jgi:hypothetical protein
MKINRQKVMEVICEGIKNGENASEIIKKNKFPSRQTIHNWMKKDVALRQAYEDARDVAAKNKEIDSVQLGKLIFAVKNKQPLEQIMQEFNLTRNELVKAFVKYPELKERYIETLETNNRGGYSSKQYKQNILEAIKNGDSLIQACKLKNTPSIRIAYKYLKTDEVFKRAYYEAMIKSGRPYTGPKDIAKMLKQHSA